jgi:FkbM family methyltransferase
MPDFISNSSYGEDAMLFGLMDRLKFMSQTDTFKYSTYMDIGCYHPVVDNNTAFLYQGGWRGTLIDPNPAVKLEVETHRPQDLFLEVAVTVDPSINELMIFNDSNSMNSMDKSFVERAQKASNTEIIKTLKVESITIDQAFEKHIDRFGSVPSVVNIDIEGMDYDVITSFSFKHRPLFFIIEDEILGSFEDSKLKKFMEYKNYAIVSANFLSGIYMDKENAMYKDIKKIGFYDTIEVFI